LRTNGDDHLESNRDGVAALGESAGCRSDESNLNVPFSVKWAAETNLDGISIFTEVQEQLGLKLESTTGPVEYVVNHLEHPTPN
jgi:uncharacterized protein (TIGR03435 family)